jgi:TatD DNase family protein
VIDCHTHLTHSDFDADRRAVLDRARKAGIDRIAIVGQDEAENRQVLMLAQSAQSGSPNSSPYLPFLGLHPDRFADARDPIAPEEIDRICAMIRAERDAIVGIGEVGLDYWYCESEDRRDLQRAALMRLAALAKEVDLPLNVHSRSAGHHTVDLLLEQGVKRVLMHAFDGKAGYALRGAEAGFVFSIPPSIVRSPQKQKLVRALPLSALALETDSPVLGPLQGERNEPANAILSLKAIAEIKGLPEQQVAEATLENTRRVFRL